MPKLSLILIAVTALLAACLLAYGTYANIHGRL
jgi:hypothetical protein